MKLWNYIKNFEKPSQLHLILLIITSLVLMLLSNTGHIPGIMDTMQFREKLSDGFITDILFKDSPVLRYAYCAYFILDCIWPAILLLAIWKFVRNHRGVNASWWAKLLFAIFSVLVVASYVSDIIENYHYAFNHKYQEVAYVVKMILYSATALCFIGVLIVKYIQVFIPALLKFLQSAGISLFILLVIGLALPKAPQVNSIIVNLYDNPVSFLLLLLAAPMYAVVLAHYPTYFNIDETHRKWYRSTLAWGIFGTIFFKYKPGYSQSSDGYIESSLNFFFRVLGIMFYGALFYIIGYTSETNFDWPLSTATLTLCLMALGIWLLYRLRKTKNRWLTKNYAFLRANLPDFYDGDFSPEEKDKKKLEEDLKTAEKDDSAIPRPETYYDIAKPVREYLFILVLTILLNLIFVIWLSICPDCSYTYWTAIVSLLCIVMQMVTFVYFRSFRSIFRFVFFNANIQAVRNAFYVLRVFEVTDKEEKKVDANAITKKRKQILDFFEENGFTENNWWFRFFSSLAFGAHSNNISFLQFTVFFGLANTVFFVLLNIFSMWSLAINPVIIILSALFLYYGIIVVLTKNFIYYKYSFEVFAAENKRRYYLTIAFSFLALFLLNRLGRIESNQLFDLPLMKKDIEKDTVFLNDYVDKLQKTNTTRYYIGAYGGGMKSNAWTMTVLHKLQQNDSTFFDKTIGISGASGGTMGLINMAAIMQSNPDSAWSEKIWDISTENILSLDLTHILGRDTFNHMLIPGYFGDLRGKDRSSKAMLRYAQLADKDYSSKCVPSFRNYWNKMYTDAEERFPILIANTTNVKGNQGMAVSVNVNQDSPEHVLLYRGADNILDVTMLDYDAKTPPEAYTLSYYDAASTSNRFPLISPAAKIETLGHYNDGGIYENSGLLSVYKLYQAVTYLEEKQECQKTDGVTNVFINIVNDKELYIKHYIKKQCSLMLKTNEVNKNTEIKAILNAVASTEMMPIFIKEELKRLEELHKPLFQFKTVYLPHRFTVAEVKAILGQQLDNGKGRKETNRALYSCVVKNDSIIRNLIDKRCGAGESVIIEPPMSRVLAEDAYQFMRNMLGHGMTKESLNEIKSGGAQTMIKDLPKYEIQKDTIKSLTTD